MITYAIVAAFLQPVAPQQVPVEGSSGQAEAVTLVEAAAEKPAEIMPVQPVAPEAEILVLRKDTPVHLMVLNEVTTKHHKEGHQFKLRVDKAVLVGGVEIIPVGAMAWGEVLSAKDSGNVGRSGKLSAKLLYVELAGQKIAISGESQSKGKSGTTETILGILALGPLGLFAKGNNAKIKAGERMTGFTTEDIEFPYEK